MERGDSQVRLRDWALGLTRQLLPIAQRMDAAHASGDYTAAVQAAVQGLQHPQTLPSARVLQAVKQDFDGSFVAFARAQSVLTKKAMLDTELAAAAQQEFANMARASWEAQRKVEDADTMPFDIYLQEYLSPRHLVPRQRA